MHENDITYYHPPVEGTMSEAVIDFEDYKSKRKSGEAGPAITGDLREKMDNFKERHRLDQIGARTLELVGKAA